MSDKVTRFSLKKLNQPFFRDYVKIQPQKNVFSFLALFGSIFPSMAFSNIFLSLLAFTAFLHIYPNCRSRSVPFDFSCSLCYFFVTSSFFTFQSICTSFFILRFQDRSTNFFSSVYSHPNRLLNYVPLTFTYFCRSTRLF